MSTSFGKLVSQAALLTPPILRPSAAQGRQNRVYREANHVVPDKSRYRACAFRADPTCTVTALIRTYAEVGGKCIVPTVGLYSGNAKRRRFNHFIRLDGNKSLLPKTFGSSSGFC